MVVRLRLQLGFDVGDRWVAAAVRLMLLLGLVVEMARKHHFEVVGEPSQRDLALELHWQEDTEAAGC